MEDKFINIYEKNIWGKGSGAGSSFQYNKKYIQFLHEFFLKYKIETILDIGCGDWQFSQYINFDNIKYRGIDIVPSVIDENNKFISENIDFVCGDISDYNQLEPYTNVDLILVKDVLQHWSNDQIDNFLSKITKSNAKYMLITSAYKHFRNKNKNGTERSIDNKYSFAPLDLMNSKYNKYNFVKVLKYKYKEVILWKK
tara:strand:- start:505 stop:1098 length:594 start_codon:yes stop_codon:yes gene_type:complete